MSAPRWLRSLAQRYRASTQIHKFGLQYDDIRAENAIVNDALRRLPEETLVARDQRLKRAFHLSLTKSQLPEHEHLTPEDTDRYLSSALKEAKDDHEARAAFRA